MSGHFGADRHTSKNLEIMVVDAEQNILAIRGSVPGHRGSLLYIRTAKTARV